MTEFTEFTETTNEYTDGTVPSGILVHPAVWPKRQLAENWGHCPFREGLGPHLTQRRMSRGLPPYQVTS